MRESFVFIFAEYLSIKDWSGLFDLDRFESELPNLQELKGD